MLRMTEGPKNYLNARPDGPFAFAQQEAMAPYNTTEWLFDYALDAVETHGAKWEDFCDAEGILSTYPLMFQDDETGKYYERQLQAEDITHRGVTILNTAAKGQDVEALFSAWRDHLYEEANTPR